MYRTCILILAALACAGGDERPNAALPIRLTIGDSGIRTPESVLHDTQADMYLVSNINGSPLDKDNNGFISHVSPDGEVHALKWIAGGVGGVTLHAPKGMGIRGDTLFVADIDEVRMFNRISGQATGSRPIRGATFLNDIAVGPDGTVYVTDTGFRGSAAGFEDAGTAAIYALGPGDGVRTILKSPSLGGPNGIAVDTSGITVVTFGSGEVYRVSPGTGTRTNLPKPPRGQLDGVVFAPGGLLVSSWEASAIYRLNSDGTYSVAFDSIPSPADIGFDDRRGAVLVPVFTQNRVQVLSVQ
jgi:hypothetical protein